VELLGSFLIEWNSERAANSIVIPLKKYGYLFFPTRLASEGVGVSLTQETRLLQTPNLKSSVEAGYA
jgi:hypothetical protein